MAETTYENLKIQDEGRIRVVTIDRPKVLNALNEATLHELDHAFTALAADTSIGAGILTGAGEKSFVAGADINELKDLDPLAAKRVAGFGQGVLTRIERLGKPVIAAVNGFAFGGGLELACACTFRVASRNAVMGLPEVKLGIIPGYGGTQRLPRLVGLGRAMEMILSGEPIDAERAERIGLVNHVFDSAELLIKAKALVSKILERGPLAVSMAMEAALAGPDGTLEDGLALERNLFGLLTTTQDMHEGMAAFLEKRRADFQGR